MRPLGLQMPQAFAAPASVGKGATGVAGAANASPVLNGSSLPIGQIPRPASDQLESSGRNFLVRLRDFLKIGPKRLFALARIAPRFHQRTDGQREECVSDDW